MKTKLGIAAMMILLIAVSAKAQAVASADVSVQSVSVVDKRRNGLTADITVHSHHDDDAQRVTLIVLLPFQTKVFRLSPECSIVPATSSYPDGVQAFVQCSLGDIPVGATKSVSIVTTTPPAGTAKRFAAFVWSQVPDPNQSNNFGEGTAP